MTFLDMPAGIGGFSLGLEAAGMTCKGQVEINDYCNKVLEKWWPRVPRWRDIRDVAGTPWILPAVDLVVAGIPCQPTSLSGKRKGARDDRWLWPDVFQIVSHLRPSWFLGENPSGINSMGLDDILADLESLGYQTVTFEIPACAVGAPHERFRTWFVAYAEHARRRTSEPGRHDPDRQAAQRQKAAGRPGMPGQDGGTKHMAHAESLSVRAGLCPDQPTGERRRRSDHCGGESADASDADDHGLQDGLRRHGGGPETDGTQPGKTAAGHCGARHLPESGLGRTHDGLSAEMVASGTEEKRRWLESMQRAWLDGTWEDGVPRTVRPHSDKNRIKRAEALGNAVVPHIPYTIGRAMMAAMREEDR